MARELAPGVMPNSDNSQQDVGSKNAAAPDLLCGNASDASAGPNQDLVELHSSHASAGDHTAGSDPCLDDALLGALTIQHDMISMIDHTLDHLTTSADLFDIPPVEFHDVGSS
jgi:hypothetical protein